MNALLLFLHALAEDLKDEHLYLFIIIAIAIMIIFY